METAAPRRWKGVVAVIGVLAGLQAVAATVYLRVESGRSARIPARAFPVERVDPPVDVRSLVLERADGGTFEVGDLERGAAVMHVWATWCGPCRDELPLLLAHADRLAERGVPVLLVSVDEGWSEVRGYFDHGLPSQVLRAATSDYRRVTTGVLPETLIVSPGGMVTSRVRGARDWRTAEARAFLDSIGGGTR